MSVTIIQRRLTHYRTPLFERLRADLAERKIDLNIVYGQPSQQEKTRHDEASLDWAMPVQNYYLQVANRQLCWMSLPGSIARSDLIILPQENAFLSNYPLLWKKKFSQTRLAFWGHGANLQSAAPQGWSERFKRWTTSQVDWWFAYTDLSARLVEDAGFPSDRITNLENSIDTEALRSDLASITPAEIRHLHNKLGLEQGTVGIFVGSLHADKKLSFLLDAASTIKRKVPTFTLILVGDGPEKEIVERFCENHAWCHYVGPKTGREKALYLAAADVMLNPGLVGLGVLDSFVAGVPMVTSDCGKHSPEIDYLVSGENGLMTGPELHAFAHGVCRLLTSDALRAQISKAAVESGRRYSIGNMAKNFANGIVAATVEGRDRSALDVL